MFIKDTVVSQLVVVSSFGFGEWYTGFILLFSLPFVWSDTVWVNVRDALVAAVGYGLRIFLEVNSGVSEQTKVMGFAWSKVRTNDLFVLLVDGQLAFSGVPLLFAGVVALLSFFGRSTGDSLASMRITSYSMSLFRRALRPGKAKRLSLMRVSSTQRWILKA